MATKKTNGTTGTKSDLSEGRDEVKAPTPDRWKAPFLVRRGIVRTGYFFINTDKPGSPNDFWIPPERKGIPALYGLVVAQFPDVDPDLEGIIRYIGRCAKLDERMRNYCTRAIALESKSGKCYARGADNRNSDEITLALEAGSEVLIYANSWDPYQWDDEDGTCEPMLEDKTAAREKDLIDKINADWNEKPMTEVGKENKMKRLSKPKENGPMWEADEWMDV
jgi:hypothetical protein